MRKMIYQKILGIVIKIAILAVWWRIGTTFKDKENKKELKKLQKYARETGRPLLNIGCGKTDAGGINIDVVKSNVNNFRIVDANQKLPFKEKQFSAIFASNIIEHLSSPEFSLKEFRRVGDKFYIGYPRWWQLGTWLTPDHKWLVFKRKGKDFRFIRYSPVVAYILVALFVLLG